MTTIQVMACLDHSPYAQAVLNGALWAAPLLGAPLTLCHVLEKPTQATIDFSGSIGLGGQETLLNELATLDAQRNKLQMEKSRLLLAEAKRQATAQGLSDITELMRHDTMVDCLIATESSSRLFVLGKRGEGHTEHHGFIGSQLERFLRVVHRPALVVQQSFTAPQRFMLAFDGSPTMIKNIQTVAQSPLLKGLPCHLIKVVKQQATETELVALAQAQAELEQAGFAVTSSILQGQPEDTLEQYAKVQQIDLMVMGAYGHSRIRQLVLGSTTQAVLQRARVAVLVLR